MHALLYKLLFILSFTRIGQLSVLEPECILWVFRPTKVFRPPKDINITFLDHMLMVPVDWYFFSYFPQAKSFVIKQK